MLCGEMPPRAAGVTRGLAQAVPLQVGRMLLKDTEERIHHGCSTPAMQMRRLQCSGFVYRNEMLLHRPLCQPYRTVRVEPFKKLIHKVLLQNWAARIIILIIPRLQPRRDC